MTEREEKRVTKYLMNVMLGKEMETEYITVKTGKDTTEVQVVEHKIPTALRLKAVELLLKNNDVNANATFNTIPIVLRDDLNSGGGI